jgi:hydroxymethylpyrimidine pyrophosphatase-like HAD family hydrolase
MIAGQRYQPARVIAVDVDGTLIRDGRLMRSLVTWLRERREEGFRLMLWSARGKAHAEGAIELFELHGLFHDVVAKPGYVVDDMGWDWTRYTWIVRKEFLS